MVLPVNWSLVSDDGSEVVPPSTKQCVLKCINEITQNIKPFIFKDLTKATGKTLLRYITSRQQV